MTLCGCCDPSWIIEVPWWKGRQGDRGWTVWDWMNWTANAYMYQSSNGGGRCVKDGNIKAEWLSNTTFSKLFSKRNKLSLCATVCQMPITHHLQKLKWETVYVLDSLGPVFVTRSVQLLSLQQKMSSSRRLTLKPWSKSKGWEQEGEFRGVSAWNRSQGLNNNLTHPLIPR